MSNCKTNTCDTTITQKSINERVSFILDDDDVLVLTIGNRIYKVPLDLSEGGSDVSSSYTKTNVPITSNGQTVFNAVIPTGDTLFAIFLNGVLADETEFNVSGTNITWSSIQLATSDKLIIWTS